MWADSQINKTLYLLGDTSYYGEILCVIEQILSFFLFLLLRLFFQLLILELREESLHWVFKC